LITKSFKAQFAGSFGHYLAALPASEFCVGLPEEEDLMAKKKKQLSPKYQVWVDIRKRFHLSHAHIQMARELGMNPKRFGGKANHKQEPWKLPLPQFIEKLYFKRFKKDRPDNVRSIEQMVKDKKRKQAERKDQKHHQQGSETPQEVSQQLNAPDLRERSAFRK